MHLREDSLCRGEENQCEQALTSWTDDVPTCRESGVGCAVNELYRRDGSRKQIHPFQHRSFRFRVDEYELCVYGVFDGFDGAQVADFVTKRIPAELLWGQLVPEKSDEAIKETLKQAFTSVDKEYFESIGDRLAARMVMRSDVQYRNSSQLQDLEDRVKAGTAGLLAVIVDNNLFIASCGDSRAVLCRGDEILSLAIEHTTDNEDELLRLSNLGVNLDPRETYQELCENQYTRCFGNYLVKGGYRESSLLVSGGDEPVIPDPEVHGGIPILDFTFLLLYTKSLWVAVAEATGSPDPDREIVNLCKYYLREETSLTGAAQAVVDHVVRQHHDRLEASGGQSVTRKDVTLLIREFNGSYSCSSQRRGSRPLPDKTLTRSSSTRPARPTRSSTATESSSVYTAGKEMPVDEDGRIQPYVDFQPFYTLWNRAKGADSKDASNENGTDLSEGEKVIEKDLQFSSEV